MVKAFNIMETMGKAAKKEEDFRGSRQKKEEITVKKISVFDLVPSEDNFYSMSNLDELKEKIELAGRVLQNLLVVPMQDGKYKILSGHRRCAASLALVEEGKEEYKFLPCCIEQTEDDPQTQEIREEIILITSNSHREKSPWEKMEEVRRIRSLVEKMKENVNFQGNTRKCIADILETSTTQVARFDAIHHNLTPAFMGEFKEGNINLSTAYELSSLTLDEQKEAFDEFKDKGAVSAKEAKAIKEKRGQEKGKSIEKEKLEWTVGQLKRLAKEVQSENDVEALEIAIKLLEGK